MDVAEWQSRLEKYFKVDGIVGGHLIDILDMESAYGKYVIGKFHGHLVLMDSFYSFFIETLRTAVEFANAKGIPKECPYYRFILLYYVTIFRSFRAAENLLNRGYPLDGYALLRDIKDCAIFLGALARGRTSFSKLLGEPKSGNITEEEYHRIKIERKKEERRILDETIRKKSGLPPQVQKELETWENLFHEEIHGSKLTFTEGMDWLLGKRPLSLGPIPNDKSAAMYMNRASEIGWLTVRTLPFLQLEPNAFGRQWTEKREVLDESFRLMVESLGKLGKEIGKAFIQLVDIKFSFPDNLHYHEKKL